MVFSIGMFLSMGTGWAQATKNNLEIIIDPTNLESSKEVPAPSSRVYYFIIGSEGFVPGSNVPYVNTYGCGGASIAASAGNALVAPVHLPHGAVITKFKVFFKTTSPKHMDVALNVN
jgi:hypothetical protein